MDNFTSQRHMIVLVWNWA